MFINQKYYTDEIIDFIITVNFAGCVITDIFIDCDINDIIIDFVITDRFIIIAIISAIICYLNYFK